jgi:hypothetical protein
VLGFVDDDAFCCMIKPPELAALIENPADLPDDPTERQREQRIRRLERGEPRGERAAAPGGCPTICSALG